MTPQDPRQYKFAETSNGTLVQLMGPWITGAWICRYVGTDDTVGITDNYLKILNNDQAAEKLLKHFSSKKGITFIKAVHLAIKESIP